jgi:acid phosphatase (class A)
MSNALLRRSLRFGLAAMAAAFRLPDAGLASHAAKHKYLCQRPFVVTAEATCTPAEQPALSKDDFVSSDHASAAWAWALVPVQAAAQRMDALLQRGHAFGFSRGVCGAHWQSDVEAGCVASAATVARLQSDETLRAQVALARDEITQAQTRVLRPAAVCGAEAAALRPCLVNRGPPAAQAHARHSAQSPCRPSSR